MLSKAKSAGAFTIALTNSADSPLADVADVHLVTFAPDEYLQPDDLSAKHSQLFMLDLLYLLIAQQNFARTATMLAASAMAVAPHRRSSRASRRNSLAPGAAGASTIASVAASAAAPAEGGQQKGTVND
jgi:fructoselysine-6-P-deglycase FrlB-like protein